MALDLSKTIQQLDRLIGQLKNGQEDRNQRLSLAIEAMKATSPESVQNKLNNPPARPFLWANATEGLADSHWPGKVPDDFCVISVDGSHIDVDRHAPVACALINIAGCILRYGTQPNAYLFNKPRIYSGNELYLTEQDQKITEVSVEGAVLGLKRTVEEIRALEPLLNNVPPDVPTLLLLDGSLVLWGIAGRGYPPIVRKEILQEGLIPALESLRLLALSQKLALAAYVSLPRSTEVVNALRLHLCTSDAGQCARLCSNRRSPISPCSMVNHLMDRDLFERLLEPGQRSGIFMTNSTVVSQHYGKNHQICFFYLHSGEEIARIEVPLWVAENNDLLSLTHTLVLDQCHRGVGYPVAVSEAHEQAIVTGPDRQRFREMVEASLTMQGLPVYTSEKSRSKRMAWL